MSKIKTVLLDLDGTLIDSRADLISAVNYVIADLGFPKQAPDFIVSRIGNGLRALLTETLGTLDPDVLKKAKLIFDSYYSDHCIDETQAYADVLECLQLFHPRMKLGVVTNKPKSHADKIVEHLGLSKFMGVLIGGDTLPQHKPHPAPLLEAMKALGGATEATIMVGDGFQDIKAGKSAGMQTCVARYGFGFTDNLLELKPDFAVHQFAELKEIVL